MKKKLISILAIFALILILVIYNNNKIIYTKQFTYLPKYNDVKLENFEKPRKEQIGTATYKIKDSKSQNVMNDYFKKLKKMS
ncbi:hypothetical protein CLOACE_15040 [Clostridium acetireducens DSM 10703]|uniref:Uncharacterized protein n=1 Tax=Clostridium acetireducens DSM 10703 TaxID=1121290 RepID=A0A1E8EYP3_9CLOT|nr:hypothetical protein [Clostridium acetireducens]OFI05809.1 hypothetical protein CLOACE_15040 [Clostridium acetireducens DSM 10703]